MRPQSFGYRSSASRIGPLLLTTLVGWASLCHWSAPASARDVATRPNFVIVLADDLGYGDVHFQGNPDRTTPNLDALAAEGLRLTDFHVSGPVCSPTRAGLLTGRYQQRCGVDGVINAGFDKNRHHGLQPDEVTFAECLHDVGYTTGLCGKWHLGYEPKYNPTHQGFDLFRGYVSGNIDYQSHFDRVGVKDWWRQAQLKDEPGYSTHLITSHAVDFIDKNHDGPFCLYIAHEAPHTPFQGPNDPAFRVEGKVVQERVSPAHKRRAYREMIEEMDRGVGDVLAALKRHQIDDRTLVLFFSDNGAARDGSNGELRGFKGSLWEGGIRVPAVAWSPATIKAGGVCEETVFSLDIMPTMLALAGTTAPKNRPLDGVNVSGVLMRDEPAPKRTLFWKYGRKRAVRRGPWKLVENAPGLEGTGLFRLDTDLSEMTNLAAKHPEVVSSLTRALADWEKSVASSATPQPGRSSK
ncbi:Arylsulfatase [Planctomycetes bacterium Pan216]|uniref:Arylsulfatase n=1 Tax=Kolteria novifilia TaxID=2527975 RepID=A0A518B2H0_9BACT|nr:Arylsulfatase [Planctomycetes bacterium Pan216]